VTIRACLEIQPEGNSSSFSRMQELLQLVQLRKEVNLVYEQSMATQDDRHAKSSKLLDPPTPQKHHSDGTKGIRVSTVRSALATEYNPESLADGLSLEQISLSTANTPSSPVQVTQMPSQQSPSSRSRPAYASTNRARDTVSLDQNIVLAWAHYIQKHSVPRDAPSIPLALSIGIAVPPGFETHLKVAAFALLESRSKSAK